MAETFDKVKHAAERKAFEVVLDGALKKVGKDRANGYISFLNFAEKGLGDIWGHAAFDRLRGTFKEGGKYNEFFNSVLDDLDHDYLKGLFMSFGFEGGVWGYHLAKNIEKKEGIKIPWVILFDPTSACNLHCTGCWASEYSRQLNLSYEDMDSIVTQGVALGLHAYVMTGGEPMVRKDDIIRLAKAHRDCGFMIFTNGTLVDQKFCDGMREAANIVLSMSIEGDEEATDSRRGKGTFQKIMKTMDLLRANKLAYGTSICYTHYNYKAVTSDEFYDFLISKGVKFSWYFHFMPVGNDATMDLVPTPEEREYMFHRIREVRGYEGGKKIFCMDFQNDGEWVNGCIAGGKNYCHINPRGDVEPCVFIHYSSANIHDQSLLDCLKQPLFRAYQAAQPFNENLLRPCPFLENPEKLQAMVKATGAKSTDMLDPESVEHLCGKCENYAKEWAPVADKLWAEEMKKKAEAKKQAAAK